MVVYYMDASALAKRYLDETGTAIVSGLFGREDALVLSCQICPVEIYSALSRRQSEGFLTPESLEIAIRNFEGDLSMGILLAEITSDIVLRAKSLILQHGLRAGDSIHLATAMGLNGPPFLAKGDELIFVCSDQRLRIAALAEKFDVLDPALPR